MDNIRFSDFQLLVDDEKAIELRNIATGFISQTCPNLEQLRFKLATHNNNLVFFINREEYVIYVEKVYGCLMIASIRKKTRTSFCWKFECTSMGSSACQWFLCFKHSEEEEVKIIQEKKGKGPQLEFGLSDMEEALATHKRANWPILYDGISNNPSVVDKHAIGITIQSAMMYVKEVNNNLFAYPDDWSEAMKIKLKDHLKDTTFTFANFSLRYSSTLGSFEFRNALRSPTTWQRLCNDKVCMNVANDYLCVCSKHGGGWREMVFQTLLNICNLTSWEDISEEHISKLAEDLCTNEITIIETIKVFFNNDGNLEVMYGSNYFSICMNIDENCQSIFKKGTICPKCSKMNYFVTSLIYIIPYDAYVLVTNQSELSKRKTKLQRIAKKFYHDLKEDELELLYEIGEIGSRAKAESVAGGFFIILMYKRAFDPLCADFAFSLPRIGSFPWRFANYFLNSNYGININRTTDVNAPPNYTLPFNLNLKIANHKAPYVYRSEDDAQVYIGVDNNRAGVSSIHDVAKHHYKNLNGRSRFDLLKIGKGKENIDGASKCVALLINSVECSPTDMETIVMLGHLASFEFFNHGKRLVNLNFSTSTLPPHAPWHIANVIKHFTKGKSIQTSTTDAGIWRTVLEPSKRQQKNPNRIKLMPK